MRHADKNRKFGRNRSQRTALLRGLAISLIEKGKIQTTEARAKELRPYVERLVTYGKRGTVAARRQASSKLGEPKQNVIQKLFGEIASEYSERNGGYTRITKTGQTQAGRNEAIIEFVK
jgi:large subunit ribosomal protein L17